jgi:iron complex transport system permease protein
VPYSPESEAASDDGQWRFTALTLLVLVVALVALMLLSLTIGRYPISFAEAGRILFTTSPFSAAASYDNVPWVVVEIVRLPRVLAVTLCGMGLALAGAAAQGVFRNPLVSPEIMGVSTGASLGGALAILLSLPAFGVLGAAFAFGLLALVLAFGLGQLGRGSGTLGLILAGIVISGLFSAGLGLVQYMADPQSKLPSIVYWLLGSFAGTTYQKLGIVSAATLIGGAGLLALSWRINLLALGTLDAVALGVNVDRLRWAVIGLIALIVAAQVSISGIVGWVGLIIPHAARMLVGAEHTRLMPVSALLGGIFLLLMDNLARSAVSVEVPIGLLTAALGTPFFAFLYYRQQSRGWADE